MSDKFEPTHLYKKDKPVKLLEITYFHNGKQYCTVEMVNKLGKIQRQTVLLWNLKPINPAK
jgi:hypothetical protein